MAFCEQCGNKINDTAKFCGKCGTPVVSGQTEAQAEIPQTGVSANEESPAVKAFIAGMACKDAERYYEAVTHFTEAIRLSPDIDEAYYFRGLIYYVKEQYDSAIADFNQAVRIAPNEAGYYSIRGNAYSCKDNLDSAIADFTKAIQLNPNDAETYGSRGMAYAGKGDMAKARADCERGLQIDPNDETLAELAKGLKQEGGGGMSVPTATPSACVQCGAPLEEGEMFCANCGTKVGAAAQYQPAQIQIQGQAEGDRVLREGSFSINNSNAGQLLLYRDRLEWHGEQTAIVIPLYEITSIRVTLMRITDVIIIKMINNIKYELTKMPKIIHSGLDAQSQELRSWVSDIKHLRNGTL